MKRIFRDFYNDERGQGVTELALVIPLLVVVLLAVFDFGRAVFYWNDENHVANLGARYAAVGGGWPACGGPAPPATLALFVACEAGGDTNNNLTSSNGTGNGVKSGVCVKVTAPSGTTTVGSPVTVTVSAVYNYLPFPGLDGKNSLIGLTSKITGTATMMLEQTLPSANSVISQAGTGC
jgi:Flp pilus assembly pilin Flp